ncbi:hypothetical protein [Streptomyces cyaneofuscatus]|uniref:hypothetical protein n=1 Tax=Streptomyces cyaneofuscatus TaxID=66883 RepID=UPI0036490274
MSIDATAGRARALWREPVAAPDAAFGTPGVCVAPDSSLAPPSWVGVVTIGDTASGATAHVLAAGLLTQWRARPAASRRVATALGYREPGAQLSVRLV